MSSLRDRRPFIAGVIVAALGLAGQSLAAEVLYGCSNGFDSPADTKIYRINPDNGDLSDIQPLTLNGAGLTRALAMDAHPTTGVLYAVVTTGSASNTRRLVTVNPSTGVCTDVGALSQNISSITFISPSTLLAVSGDGATPPETLYILSTADATATQLFALGNGADGETIAYHPPTGLLYHSSGNSAPLFESVHPLTRVVTPIGTSMPTGECFAMGWSRERGQMVQSDINSQLFTVDLATGARTLVGDMSDQLTGGADNRAVVFVPVPCPADFNHSGSVSVQDIFDFLAAYFAGCP
jgi:hypothetical protein